MRAFVGRADELAELQRALAAARAGRPRVALIEGEAGIGKSSLLARFVSVARSGLVVRASCDESERRLAYGVISQLVACAQAAGYDSGSSMLGDELREALDPLAVGAELLGFLGDLQRREDPVLVVVDDVHWADGPSARALLFTLRRLQADRVLVLVSARTGEVERLGDGWPRFLAGSAERIALGGLAAPELVDLAAALGIGELSGSAATSLRDHTGGNPLHCRALLEELGPAAITQMGSMMPAPRALARLIVDRLSSLTPSGQRLVIAASALGRRSELGVAAALAELDDPLPALAEAAQLDLLIEQPGQRVTEVAFVHPLVHSAVYDSLSPVARRRLHRRAAALLGSEDALAHRIAATVGADARLAEDLEAAALAASAEGRMAQAGAWLSQSAAITSEREERDRRVLDAIEALLACGEPAQAGTLMPAAAAAPRSARQSALLGELELLAGRAQAAEARLERAWQGHDPVREAAGGAGAATHLLVLCLITGRIPEAISWGKRAVAASAAPAGLRHRAAALLALGLWTEGHAAEARAQFAFLPTRAAEVPPGETDALVVRGMFKLYIEDLDGAIADLNTASARLRAGVPLRYSSQCLSCLSEAEYRLGAWDDALLHGELSVSLAHGVDRSWDYGYVHSCAASVPAARGDWPRAQAHVEAAKRGAEALGAADAITAAATAQARLASTSGDLAGVLDAAAAARATGKAVWFGRPERYDWLVLEVDALIGLHRLQEAARSLAELQAALFESSPASAIVAGHRLRGMLATAVGDTAGAAAAFAAAWRHAAGLRRPLALALLEIADARRLAQEGRRDHAVASLRSARARLAGLRSRPYIEVCDRELAACGAPVLAEQGPGSVGLTPAELAVARLVATGRSNREAAAELYLSVKTVEFHLSHIFAKLGIRSRRELAGQLSTPAGDGRELGSRLG